MIFNCEICLKKILYMIFVSGESNRFIDCEEVPVTMGFTHRPARKNAGMISSLV